MAYKPGENYGMCDQCGFRRYVSDMKKTWDGLIVCADTCWEEKHPSLVPHKLPSDKITPKVIRPEKYTFIEPPETP